MFKLISIKGDDQMNRFFFDIVTNATVWHDFHGRSLPRLEDARELAGLIALDLECTGSDDCVGSEVQVRNLSGEHLFSIRVGDPGLMAA